MPTPINQLLSRTLYATDGSTTEWDFSFSGGYISKSHVKALIEAPSGERTEIVVTEDMLTGPYTLRITPALATGKVLTIYRDTPKDLPLVDFTDESGFSEVSLDTSAKQAVFIAAETVDTVNASSSYDAEQAAAQAAASAALADSLADGAALAALSATNSANAATVSANAALAASEDAEAYASTAALAVSTLENSLATSSGASLVGYLPAGTGAVPTTVQNRLRAIDLKTVNVHDYVTGGLGTRESPWTGWATGITWAGYTQYDFLDGVYGYTTSPNFGLSFLRLNTRTGTVIRHTGTGYAMIVDAGPNATDFAIGIDISCFLESSGNSDGGVLCRGVSRSKFDISFRDMPNTCFREIFGVCNTLKLMKTAFAIGQEVQPVTLLSVERRSVGEETSAGVYYLIAENCSGYGVVLTDCLNGVFLGGTSESNDGGYYIDSRSNFNTFIGIDLEVNTTADLVCNGSYNTFINTLSTKSATFAGKGNTVIGGAFNTVASNGTTNTFDNVRYAANGGAFTNNGVNTSKRNVYNLSTDVADIDTYPPVESIKSGSGAAATTSGVAKTILIANKTGRCEVTAYITSGDAANFTASATVLTEGGASARIIANNGGHLTLTLSGLDVKVTQTSGAAQNVSFKYVWLA